MGGRWCGKGVCGSVSRVVEIEEEIAGAVADVEEEEVPAMGMGREGAQGSDTKLCYESQVCLHYREREVTYFGYTAWDPILQALPALAYIEGLQRYNVTEYKSVFNTLIICSSNVLPHFF
jgi:hypothetical protein